MISNGENWHYLAVKSLSRLLRGITSNHDGDYYCLNCFHSYRTENKLNAHTWFPPTWRTWRTWSFQGEKVISPEIREKTYFERISGRN